MVQLSQLKTDQNLIDAMKVSASKKLNYKEMLEQRISYVYGSMGHNSTVTKDQVRHVILELQGETRESDSI